MDGLRSKAKRIAKPAKKNSSVAQANINQILMAVEILAETDSSGFSEEIKRHYQSHILPLLKKLVAGGEALQMVFHTDPAKIEIRRLIK